MVVPFLFGGCFILFKDREVIHSAMIAAGARALLAFITSAHGESVSGFGTIVPIHYAADLARYRSIADMAGLAAG
jgi:hypothetical protein